MSGGRNGIVETDIGIYILLRGELIDETEQISAASKSRMVVDEIARGVIVKSASHLALGFITDHLGNVAVVVNLSATSSTSTNNAILQQNEYTPFGTKLNVSGLMSQAANRYRYAGKEEQDIAGMDLRLLDFGARYYDSFTCRWNVVDPLAHKYFGMSPYNYCGNDPVNRIDPDGKEVRPLGEVELEVIRNTLPKEARQYVQINESGNINKHLLNQCNINSTNLEALKTLVNSDITYEYTVSSNYQNNAFYDNGDGNYRYGVTMMPGAKIDPSPDDNIHVYTANFLAGEKQASNAAHELFGHAYYYDLKQNGIDVNPNHTFGNTGETQTEYVEGIGFLEIAIFRKTNTKLENHIKNVENEAVNNFKAR